MTILLSTLSRKVQGIPDVSFTCVQTAPDFIEAEAIDQVYSSRFKTINGESVYSIYRAGTNYVVHFTRVCDFYLSNNKIIAHVLDPSVDYLEEIRLLGEIFSILLELKGILTLHASSKVINHGAVGFLSTNKGGKTSIAAALMQDGFPLLNDDILPIEKRGNNFFADRDTL